MIKQVKLNNYEFFRLKDVETHEHKRNDSGSTGRFWQMNGLNWFVDGDNKLYIYSRDFSTTIVNGSTLQPSISGAKRTTGGYYNNYYYLISVSTKGKSAIIKCEIQNNILSQIGAQIDIPSSTITDIKYYNGHWLLLNGGGHSDDSSILVYSDDNGAFTTNSTLLHTYSFRNKGHYPNIHYICWNTSQLLFNYNTSEVLINACSANSANYSITFIYDLDKLISSNGDDPLKKYKSNESPSMFKFPNHKGAPFGLVNGHYIFCNMKIIDGIQYLIGFYVYDFDFNLISITSNIKEETAAIIFFDDNKFFNFDDYSRTAQNRDFNVKELI